MKQLILVRHGEYSGRNLSEYGRRQITELAEKLKVSVNGGRVIILSSIAGRAKQSAEILGKAFEVDIEEHEVLWSENSHREDLPATLKLVREKKGDADVLILVTHLEYVERFPKYFGNEELGQLFSFQSIDKGEAVDIDCENKTVTTIR